MFTISGKGRACRLGCSCIWQLGPVRSPHTPGSSPLASDRGGARAFSCLYPKSPRFQLSLRCCPVAHRRATRRKDSEQIQNRETRLASVPFSKKRPPASCRNPRAFHTFPQLCKPSPFAVSPANRTRGAARSQSLLPWAESSPLPQSSGSS